MPPPFPTDKIVKIFSLWYHSSFLYIVISYSYIFISIDSFFTDFQRSFRFLLSWFMSKLEKSEGTELVRHFNKNKPWAFMYEKQIIILVFYI